MPIRTIMDTDIGTDVDDCLALAFVLGSPEFALEGVTCVYGDVRLRGRMVQKLLALRGRNDVPVHLGAGTPLLGLQPVYWEGHEGQGLLDGEDNAVIPDEHAVDYITRTVMANPGQIHLLAIGPLTNIALALRKEPALARHLAHLTIMGGALRGPSAWHLPLAEHNIKCDPEAAHIVVSSGAPMTVVPLDVTTQCRITRKDVETLRESAGPFLAAVIDQIERYPRFAANGMTYLHDPLAAAVMIAPDLVETDAVRVSVETEGRLTKGMTLIQGASDAAPATAQVACRVDAARAEERIVTRLGANRVTC